MIYIIASIGRCGSKLITQLVKEAVGTSAKKYFASTYEKLNKVNGNVYKTHAHFKYEPDFDYCAIFVWGDVDKVISSLYNMCGNDDALKEWVA